MAQIDASTLITSGLPLSQSFIIDHLTTGAFHYILGKWVPQFTSPITTFPTSTDSSVPVWKIASNLQLGAQNILEPLLQEFGGDLILRSGLATNGLGTAMSVQVQGFQGNMYNLMPTIQKLASKASGITMVQGMTSFANISFDPSNILKNVTSELPQITSIDSISNQTFSGLQNIAGFL